MLENKWDAVPPQLFTANGSAQGLIQVADTAGFRVKQVAFLKNTTFALVQAVPVQIKRVLSPTLLIVGTINPAQIGNWPALDISGFLVADGSYIGAEQQEKTATPGPDQHYNAVYESDPVIADRVIQVDKYGNRIDSVMGSDGINRIAVDAEITVDTIQLLNKPYDTGETTYPSSTEEIYTTYVGGYSGTPVQQITINYTDATKNSLLNWQRANWNGSSWVVG